MKPSHTRVAHHWLMREAAGVVPLPSPKLMDAFTKATGKDIHPKVLKRSLLEAVEKVMTGVLEEVRQAIYRGRFDDVGVETKGKQRGFEGDVEIEGPEEVKLTVSGQATLKPLLNAWWIEMGRVSDHKALTQFATRDGAAWLKQAVEGYANLYFRHTTAYLGTEIHTEINYVLEKAVTGAAEGGTFYTFDGAYGKPVALAVRWNYVNHQKIEWTARASLNVTLGLE